jgi:hypothetical protein
MAGGSKFTSAFPSQHCDGVLATNLNWYILTCQKSNRRTQKAALVIPMRPLLTYELSMNRVIRSCT